VRLHFAEIWFRAPGRRVFDVALEGRRVLEDLDAFRAGFATAKVESFDGIQVRDGVLDIEFAHGADTPFISGIEVERGG
jgi:hypothetical protein